MLQYRAATRTPGLPCYFGAYVRLTLLEYLSSRRVRSPHAHSRDALRRPLCL
jgi:hypothetical protein